MSSIIVDFLRRQAETYLYESTQERFSDLFFLPYNSTFDAIQHFFAVREGEERSELWLDILILLAITIITVSITNCMARLCWWGCYRIPQQVKEIDEMRKGNLPYQKKEEGSRAIGGASQLTTSQKRKGKNIKKKGKKKHSDSDKEGDVPTAESSFEDDFQFVTKAIGEMRQRIKASESALQRKESAAAEKQSTSFQETGEQRAEKPAETLFKKTKRQSKPASATSFIRGLPSVQFLLSSPNYQFLVFNCRSKRKTYVIPQARRLRDGVPEYTGKKDEQEVEKLSPSTFLSAGRALLQNKSSFTVLEESIPASFVQTNRLEFYSAQFLPSAEKSVLILAERSTDSFLMCQLTGLCGVEALSTYKMPGHRLVSSLSHWSVLCSSSHSKKDDRRGVTWEGLVNFQPTDAVVELLQITSLPSSSSSSGTFNAASTKLKVGSAASWSHDRGLLAVGGSFIREPRLCTLELRAAKKNEDVLQLEAKSLITLGNKAEDSPFTSSIGKLRVVATALIQPGLPASFNTRSLWIIFLENGVGGIYNFEDYDSPELVSTFTDTDFAGFTPDEPVKLLTAMQGSAYKERLVLALVQGSNISVHYQGGFVSPFEMVHRQDLYAATDGKCIDQACFLCEGRGLALCGRDDGTGVRLFELVE